MSSAAVHMVSDSSWEEKRKQLAMEWFFFRVEWAMLANEQAFWGGVSKYFKQLHDVSVTALVC